MKKPCPFCQKRTLKKVKDTTYFPLARVHHHKCFSCLSTYLPFKQEKKINKRYKIKDERKRKPSKSI